MAGVATAVMLVGLAAIGGVGRAANELSHIARVATGQTNSFGTRLAVGVNSTSAANAQYGGRPVSPATVSKTGDPGQSGNITVTSASPSGGHTVSVTWDKSSFTAPVVVHADPTPPDLTSSALIGSGNQVMSIVVTDTSGNAVHQLAAPLAVRFANPPKNFVPGVSEDGVNFRLLTKLDGTTLPDGQQDGYYVDTNGDVIVLTRHLTFFAVLYTANITTSETGKTLPQAGSGKFGDPTRNHTGAPVLKQVGSKIAPQASLQSTKVPFDFSVDEQAAVYISIYDAKGNPVMIRTTGTLVRGHRYSGKAVHALHLVILRPGQINTLLNVAPGTFKAGQTYKIRITAVDFDGHKVTEYTTFTG
jgi:hypothetical protein